jgi:hypothetical protein
LKLYAGELRRRLSAGERLPLTHDQTARAADRLLAAERREGQDLLLRTVASGLSRAFAGAITGSPRVAGELEPPFEIVDVEDEGESDDE